MSSELPQTPDFTIQEEHLQYGAEKRKQLDTVRLIWASKPQKEPSHKEKSIVIDSVMKYREPQMKAPRVAPLEGASTYAPQGIRVVWESRTVRFRHDERRFVVPALSSSLVLIDPNQQNNHFFAPFAYFAVKNSANRNKPAPKLPSNIFDDILKVKRE